MNKREKYMNSFREDWRVWLLLVAIFFIALIGSLLPWVGAAFATIVLITPPAIAVMVMKFKRGVLFALAPTICFVVQTLLAYLVTAYGWPGSLCIGLLSVPYCWILYQFWDDL